MKQCFLMGLATLLCFAQPNTANAQKTEPVFEIKAGNMIANARFMIQAATGEIITGNDLKMIAVDPDKKTVIWENKDFLMLTEDDITVIEGTPFLKIERQKMVSLANSKNTYLIQANDGKIVYDSKDEGIKVRGTLVMPQLNGLLMKVVKDGFLSLTLIDFATAKEAWTVPLAKEKTGGIGIGALKRAIKSHLTALFTVPPVVDGNGNLIVVNKDEVFAISKAGTVAWKKTYDENVSDVYLSSDRQSIFIGYKKYIDKLNSQNGNSLLPEPIKMRDELNGILPMGNDYIVYNAAGINIMDAAGNMKWKKDTKLGEITQVQYNDKGILAIEAVKDDETKFFWVGIDGKDIWDEEVKGGLMLAELTEKGVMYVTSERSNIFTYEKGKDVWDKDIKLKGKPFFGTDEKNRILYAFAKEKLHAFNFADYSYRLVAEDIKLRKFNEDEESAQIDIRNGGAIVVISANQNVAAVQTADGKLLYNNYFKDIGNSRKKLMRFAGAAMSVAGAALDVKAISKGNIKLTQNVDENGKPVDNITYIEANSPGGDLLGASGGALFAAARKRYLATQATKDNLYILSEMPEGNGMLVWNKDKGEISKKITFNDITPQYVVDEAYDMVYVMVGNTIQAYSLK
jgi:hypothetical protein